MEPETKFILAFFIGLPILMLAGYAFKVLFLPVHVATAQIDSAHQIIDKTYDPDNAIYNYEWFKTQYEKIQGIRVQIQNTNKEIESYKTMFGDNPNEWDRTTKEEYNQLNRIKLGQMNQEENLINEYNARSKMANRNIFDDKLPWNVDKILW